MSTLLSEANLSQLINELAKREGETGKRYNTRPNVKRNSLLPGTDPNYYEFYKIQEAMIWTPEEIDFSNDREDFKKLPEWQQKQLKKIFGFFSVADTQVLNNIDHRFLLELDSMEEKAPLIIQGFMELVHANTYDLITMSIFDNEEERDSIFYAINNDPYVRRKSEFIDKYAYSDIPLVYRLFAFGIVEGVFFAFLFCVIFSLYSSGKMKGIIVANLQISKDETVHRNYAGYLFRVYRQRMELKGEEFDMNLLNKIVGEAIDIETAFVNDMHDENDPNSKESYIIYIKKVMDDMLIEFGLNPIYKVDNPIKYMEQIGNSSKTNFYEMRVTDYRRFDLGKAMNWKDKFNKLDDNILDEDF